ncbi:hypothetical protein ACH5RR_006572 [Cinchona calisaya]|uniref:Uncharacterized protein n=1 Tax=Cinchona calisaya TaxID=153742 RepID=A0ABD3APF6_9GENT
MVKTKACLYFSLVLSVLLLSLCFSISAADQTVSTPPGDVLSCDSLQEVNSKIISNRKFGVQIKAGRRGQRFVPATRPKTSSSAAIAKELSLFKLPALLFFLIISVLFVF